MDCLFKTTTINTFEEFKRFWTTMSKNKLFYIIWICIILAWIPISIFTKSYFVLIIAVAYLIFFYFVSNHNVKKVFESNKALKNAAVEYEFYSERFTENSPFGSETIGYDKLHKIVETKTNFYLMVSKNQGFLLAKKNFPEGLDDFLRQIKKEYKLK